MRWSTVTVCALMATGCGGISGRPSLYEQLQSSDHDVRAAAVVEAGRQRDQQAAPYLVDRLDDEGADIRLFAIQALRRITGEDLGYRSYDKPSVRLEAVRRWRQWLDEGASEEAVP